MKTSLDCMPCFVRQALDAARRASTDPAVHERVVRDVLGWAQAMDMDGPPPLLGWRIQARLRQILEDDDPYRAVKAEQNRMAMDLLPDLRARLAADPDPFGLALRLAIAGNVIDLGAKASVSRDDLREAVDQAVRQPVFGDVEAFRTAVSTARDILYVADNAGEIVFDRLLIERMPPEHVTLAVRGRPVLNDATRQDARVVGLDAIVPILDSGTDVPGTWPQACSDDFVRRFSAADLVIAKGQGNYETLSDFAVPVFFLFRAKCPVIAEHAGVAIGAHVVVRGTGDRPLHQGQSQEP